MKLSEAQKVAEGVARLFEPFCDRIEIAGSIRRQRPECNDVDLVVIPRVREQRDLLGNIERRENLLLGSLVDYVSSNREWVKWTASRPMQEMGPVPKADAKYFSITGRHAQIDFFVATETTWATTLLTRTGSKEHNVWIAQRAIAKRAKFLANEGLWLHDRGVVHPKDETEFYELLGLSWIDPKVRERIQLMHLDAEEACR